MSNDSINMDSKINIDSKPNIDSKLNDIVTLIPVESHSLRETKQVIDHVRRHIKKMEQGEIYDTRTGILHAKLIVNLMETLLN